MKRPPGGTAAGADQQSLHASPALVAAAKAFALERWRERARETGAGTPPADLSRACKFCSLFAAHVFGGEVRGNFFHQWAELPDGRRVDLCEDAADVASLNRGLVPAYAASYAQAMGRCAPEILYTHDSQHMGSHASQVSAHSVKPRVRGWTSDFRAQYRHAPEACGIAWPVVAQAAVFHLGTLNPADKGSTHNRTSHEGNGLSVSVDPDAWRTIARLGGSALHELRLPGGLRFLDAHQLTSVHRALALSWALQERLVQPTSLLELSWYDTEAGERRAQCFDGQDPVQEERAGEEYQTLVQEGYIAAAAAESDPEGPRLNRREGHRATGLLSARIGFAVPLGNVEDLALTLFVQDVLAAAPTPVHGTWWNDELNVARLSAPRGVMLPNVVPACATRLLHDDAALARPRQR